MEHHGRRWSLERRYPGDGGEKDTHHGRTHRPEGERETQKLGDRERRQSERAGGRQTDREQDGGRVQAHGDAAAGRVLGSPGRARPIAQAEHDLADHEPEGQVHRRHTARVRVYLHSTQHECSGSCQLSESSEESSVLGRRYYWRDGTGNGSKSAILFLEGGGWWVTTPRPTHSCTLPLSLSLRVCAPARVHVCVTLSSLFSSPGVTRPTTSRQVARTAPCGPRAALAPRRVTRRRSPLWATRAAAATPAATRARPHGRTGLPRTFFHSMISLRRLIGFVLGFCTVSAAHQGYCCGAGM